MDLALNETQLMIQETTRSFVSTQFDRDTLLALDSAPVPMTDTLWRQVCDLGWLAMAIPQEYGGLGNTLTDVAVLFEELGRGPVPGAFFSSGVLSASIILGCASTAQCRRWLPDLASGNRVFALAYTEPDYGWEPERIQMRLEAKSGEFLLSGTKLFVHDAASATDLLVAVRDQRGALVLARIDSKNQGVCVRVLPGFMSGVCEVTFDRVAVSGDDVLGEAHTHPETGIESLAQSLQRAMPILCAYKVGGCAAVFDKSVEYSRERVQFGQPIGRFQRVQDHIIHIVNFLDAARWTTYEAVWKLDVGHDAAASVHLCKTVASDSYLRACDFAHEVHAGMGVVREYGLTLHTKMSRSLFHCLGAPEHHRQQMQSALGFC